MAKQYTKRALYAIERYEAKMQYYEEKLASTDDAAQISYYMGLIDGAIFSVEETLHYDNCYNGFSYCDSNRKAIGMTFEDLKQGKRISDHPEFRSWRKIY